MDQVRKKAALYIRVSTEEQALEGQSVDAQIETLSQYCRLYDIEVYQIYQDLGISGKGMKGRPGLLKMLRDALERKFDIVLVWKISRLSRSLKDLLFIIEQLEQKGIIFSSYSERFDTSNAVGRMTLQLLGSIAEFERNTIVDNVKLGLLEYARKGGKTGTVLGYDNTGRQLIINPKEAEVVQLIYQLFVEQQLSLSDIAAYLNQRGYKTKRNKDFRKDGIGVILRNPVYIGINRHQIGSREEYQIQGSHMAIIDKALWKSAQERISNSRQRRANKSSSAAFILTGKLLCPLCSMPMCGFSTGSGARLYRYYKCKGCCKLIKASLIEDKVLQILYRLVNEKSLLLNTNDGTRHSVLETTHETTLQKLQRQIAETDNLLEKYLYLLEKDEFRNSSIILEKLKKTEEKLKLLLTKKNDLEALEEKAAHQTQDQDDHGALLKIFQKPQKDELKRMIEQSIRYINIDKDFRAGVITFTHPVDGRITCNFDL